ncbi:MAG: GAF domain-containing protein, partial [Anaerolineales bacterium]|nr:GAF domain-containing protein [Anaerolineales bacterium]
MNGSLFPRGGGPSELRDALIAARSEVLHQLLRRLRWVVLAALLVQLTLVAATGGAWVPAGLTLALALGLFGLAAAAGLNFNWRAGGLAALFYGVAAAALVLQGAAGPAPLYLLAAVVLATLMFGTRLGFALAGLGAATWLAAAAVSLSLPAAALPAAGWLDWLTAGVTLLMLSAAVVLPQRQFLESQALALLTEQQKNRLEHAQHTLLLQAQDLEQATAQLAEANQQLRGQSQALEHRAARWAVSAEVARAAAAVHDLVELLNTTVYLIAERFGFYHAGIFLRDETGDWAVLRAANSAGGQRMLARGHRLRVGQQGIVGFVMAAGQPRIALNVGEDAVHFRNPDLPETQSEMAVPMRSRAGVIGALDVQSTAVNAFSDDDIAALQTLADQLAVAIDNARLFEQNERQIEALRAVQPGQRQVTLAPGQPLAFRYDGADVVPLEPEPAEGRRGPRVEGAWQVPIHVADDMLGLLEVKRASGDWSLDDLQLTEAIAERMGLALENARLLLETQASARRMGALSEAVLSLTGPQYNLGEVHTRVVERARWLLQADQAELWQPAGGSDDVLLTAAAGPAARRPTLGQRQRRAEGLAAAVYGKGEPEQRDAGGDSELAAPLIWQDRITGVLLARQAGRRFSREEVSLAQLFAAAAASAIANARLLEETRRRLQELETLNSIGAIVSSQADLYTMLRQIGDRVLAIFGVNSGYIGLYDSHTNLIEFPYFLENGVPAPTPPVPLGQGLSSIIIQTRRPLLINQNAAQKMQELGAVVLGDPAQSYLAVPIVVGDEVTGILNVQSTTQAGLFSEDDVRLLSIIGASVGVAIENARLLQQTQTALAETEALYQAGADLNTAQGFADLLAGLRRHSSLGGAQLIELHYFDRPWSARQLPEESELIARWSVGEAGEAAPARQTLPAWIGQHLRPDLPVLIEDIVGDQRLDDTARAAYLIRYGAQSAAFLPLVVGGDWVGYLSAFFTNITAFAEAETRRLASLSRQAAVQAENFRSTALIERRAQQLVTAAEVSRAAISLTNTEELITQVVELIRERFGLYYVALFLTDADARWAVLVYATGEAGRQLMERGHRLEVGGNSMVGWATGRRQARVAQDVEAERIRFANPYLPDTRSELALPLVVGDRVLGALSVQSTQRKAFGESEVTSLQTMADQVAIAIRNAQVLGDLRLAVRALDYERFLLQTLLDNVPDRIYFKDEHSRFIRVSAAMAQQFNLAPDQVIGKSDFDFFGEERARQAYQDEQELMRSGQPVLNKLERETWPDRPDTWALTSRLVLPAAENRPAGTFGIARDVTELKTAQDEAQRRARQLLAAAEVSRAVTSLLDERQLIRQAVDLIRERFQLYYVALFLLDDDGRRARLQYAAGGGAEAGDLLLKLGHQLDLGGSSLVGQAMAQREARIAADVAEAAARFANPLTPETRSEAALPLLAGDDLLGALSVQSAERDAFAAADVAALQTMADQIASALQNARLFRRVELQEFNASALARLTQAVSAHLEEAEVWETLAAELLAIFRADGVIVYQWDADAATFTPRRVLAAPGAGPAVGLPLPAADRPDLAAAAEQPGVHVRALGPVGPDQLRESMTAALPGQESVDSLVEVVHTGPASGLTESDTALLQAAVRAAAAALQIARLYALQRATAERLLEVDRLKTQFLANMSHELRTPLNSIIGFSRVILKGIDGPINDLQRQDLGSIYNSGQHLLGLINDILDVSRIEAGKMELSSELVPLVEIFDGVLATTRGLIKDRPIEIVRDYPAQLPAVRGDSTRLRQVLLNLLSNAAKFTEAGQITLGARAAADEAGRPLVEIRVNDTGLGIPPADMPKLFERFSQVDGSP